MGRGDRPAVGAVLRRKMIRNRNKYIVGWTVMMDMYGNVYCPACGKLIECSSGGGIRHHMCKQKDGGHPGATNVVFICDECHGAIHHYAPVGRELFLKCVNFMTYVHGLKLQLNFVRTRELIREQAEAWHWEAKPNLCYFREVHRTSRRSMWGWGNQLCPFAPTVQDLLGFAVVSKYGTPQLIRTWNLIQDPSMKEA